MSAPQVPRCPVCGEGELVPGCVETAVYACGHMADLDPNAVAVAESVAKSSPGSRGGGAVLDEEAQRRLNSAIVMATSSNGYVVPTGDVEALDAVLNPVCEVVAALVAQAHDAGAAEERERIALALDESSEALGHFYAHLAGRIARGAS